MRRTRTWTLATEAEAEVLRRGKSGRSFLTSVALPFAMSAPLLACNPKGSIMGETGCTDVDQDGLTTEQEAKFGTDPSDPDSDNDGADDGWEAERGLDPLVGDTDGAGTLDLVELADGTDPANPKDDLGMGKDGDGDGLSDKWEAALSTDPSRVDSDDDGLSDGIEVTKHSTLPRSADTDGDGVPDGEEVAAGTDPHAGCRW